MKTERMSIRDLADAAGLSRRAVRFYVQRGLLARPHGRGRGSEYDNSHLQRLDQIRELQAAGHSLDAIGRILAGEAVPPPSMPRPRTTRSALTAELRTRLHVADGVEFSFDATRYQPDIEDLLAIRDAIRQVLNLSGANGNDDAPEEERGT